MKKDEREIQQSKNMVNEVFVFVYYGLLVSVLVQQLIFDAMISQYIVEMCLFVASSVYLLIRRILCGHKIFLAQN